MTGCQLSLEEQTTINDMFNLPQLIQSCDVLANDWHFTRAIIDLQNRDGSGSISVNDAFAIFHWDK